MSEEPRTIYRLVVDVAGPGYRDRVTIEDEDPISLQPTFVDVGGVSFERYGDELNYQEIRADYVASRSLNPVEIVDRAERIGAARHEERPRPQFGPPGGEE